MNTSITLLMFMILASLIISDKKVVNVVSIIRHGARSPYYRDFINQVDIFGHHWSINPADLTQVGRRQLYLLGLRQRELFDDLLGEYYSSSEIIGFTSDKSRTKESIQAYFQGLFVKSQKLSQLQIERAFPPIQVSSQLLKLAHSTSFPISNGFASISFNQLNPKTDRYFFMQTQCKGFPNFMVESNADIDKNILQFNKKWSNVLSKNFGLDVDEHNPSKARIPLWNIADTYIADYINGFDLSNKLPKSIQEEFFKDIQEFFSDDMFKGTYSELNNGYYLARVSKTKFLQDIIGFFDKRIELGSVYNTSNPKMLTYLLHDYDVVEIMVIFNKIFNLSFNTTVVPSSFVNFVLLYDTDSGEYSIEVTINEKQFISSEFSQFKEKLSSMYLSTEEINKFCGY